MGGVSARRPRRRFHLGGRLQGQRRVLGASPCLCRGTSVGQTACCRGRERAARALARHWGQRDRAPRGSSSPRTNRGDCSSPQARGGGGLGLGLATSCEEMPPQGGTGSSARAGRRAEGTAASDTSAGEGLRPQRAQTCEQQLS